jgi:hypothetical protein
LARTFCNLSDINICALLMVEMRSHHLKPMVVVHYLILLKLHKRTDIARPFA